MRFRLQGVEVSCRRNDYAACANHRLRDDGGRCARRLHVVHLESDLHAGAIAMVAAMLHGTAIGIGLRNDERPRHRRPVALAVARVRHRAGIAGHPVPRAAEPDHFKAARIKLGHLDRGFVAFAARAQQKRFAQRPGDDLRQLFRQLHDAARNHAREEMQRGVAARFDGRHDVRMAVPDGGAHLAGGEIQNSLSGSIPDVASLRAFHDFRIDVAAVADQVLAKIRRRVATCVHAWLLAIVRLALDLPHQRTPSACRIASNASRPFRMCWRTALAVPGPSRSANLSRIRSCSWIDCRTRPGLFHST